MGHSPWLPVGALEQEIVTAAPCRCLCKETLGLVVQHDVAGFLALARGVLKRPDILVLNQATSNLDGRSQTAVMEGVLKEFEGRGVVWILHRASLARRFDHILIMRGGKVVEDGAFDELDKEGGALRDLMDAE